MTLNRYDPRDPRFARLGRYNADEPDCQLFWSGSGIAMTIRCRCLEVETEATESDHTPWLGVMIDGEPVARFPLMPGRHRCAVLEGMDATVAHEVAILRDTQPHDTEFAPLRLMAVYTDGEPAPAPEKPRLIEFIGDSLTVGEGLVGAKQEDEWRMVWISNLFAFPTLVAREMDAEKRVVALGGWGCWSGWDGDRGANMGRIYRQLCGVVPGGEVPYDFVTQRKADAIVINLGTNDSSAVSKEPEANQPAARQAVTEGAARLMEIVRETAPEAAILWAYGLCGTPLMEPLETAVALRRKAGDRNVHFLRLTDCDGDVGSRNHPSREAQARAAREISAKLRELID